MNEWLALADAYLAGWFPPLWRIVAWACFSAAVSMSIYAAFSPQKKLLALKAAQKDVRARLMRYEGDWPGLKRLIAGDLRISLRRLGLALLPFAAAMAPVLGLMLGLYPLFDGQAYTAFGPEWMRGFEFWYILTLMIVSFAIKLVFRIE